MNNSKHNYFMALEVLRNASKFVLQIISVELYNLF